MATNRLWNNITPDTEALIGYFLFFMQKESHRLCYKEIATQFVVICFRFYCYRIYLI